MFPHCIQTNVITANVAGINMSQSDTSAQAPTGLLDEVDRAQARVQDKQYVCHDHGATLLLQASGRSDAARKILLASGTDPHKPRLSTMHHTCKQNPYLTLLLVIEFCHTYNVTPAVAHYFMYVMCLFGCRVGFEAALNELLSKFFIKQFRSNPLPYLQDIERKIENQITPDESAFIPLSFCLTHHMGNKCNNSCKSGHRCPVCAKPHPLKKCEKVPYDIRSKLNYNRKNNPRNRYPNNNQRMRGRGRGRGNGYHYNNNFPFNNNNQPQPQTQNQ